MAHLTLKKALVVLDKEKADAGRFIVQGTFRLGAGNDGANPATEGLTLGVGTFSQILPASVFVEKQSRKKTSWTFKAAKGGSGTITKLNVSKPGDEWAFIASASGIDLAGTVDPIIRLQIGDDASSRIFSYKVTDTARKTIYRFPPGKLQSVIRKAVLALDKQNANNDRLSINGAFQPDAGSDGSEPSTEEVTLTVGGFSQTLDPSAFTRKRCPLRCRCPPRRTRPS